MQLVSNFVLNRAPDVIIHGAESTAPPAGTVLADSLALSSAGKYVVFASVGSNDTIVQIMEIAHRNAANGADVELGSFGATGSAQGFAYFSVASGERVVVRNNIVGTAAKIYQVDLYVWTL